MFTLYGKAWDLLYPLTGPLFQCGMHGCLIGAWHRVTSNQSPNVSASLVVCTFFLSLDSREATAIQHRPVQAPWDSDCLLWQKMNCHMGAWNTHTNSHGYCTTAIRNQEMHPSHLRQSTKLSRVPLNRDWRMHVWCHIYTCDASPQSSGCCIYTITWAFLFHLSCHCAFKSEMHLMYSM